MLGTSHSLLCSILQASRLLRTVWQIRATICAPWQAKILLIPHVLLSEYQMQRVVFQ